jgi:hypothetical protein
LISLFSEGSGYRHGNFSGQNFKKFKITEKIPEFIQNEETTGLHVKGMKR